MSENPRAGEGGEVVRLTAKHKKARWPTKAEAKADPKLTYTVQKTNLQQPITYRADRLPRVPVDADVVWAVCMNSKGDLAAWPKEE